MGSQWQNTQDAVNANTNTYAQAKGQPGFWSRLSGSAVGAAGQAAGAYAGRPPAGKK
ncbi:hypothetical protein [Streptococcus pneumoniae]|uniref:hypothetical protein n=1 Tax=Streptococcus pneumoniae TaxID=1313 RepID=UPI0018B0657A|nr:hypothetical protein [Streptococcus pneumoniae]